MLASKHLSVMISTNRLWTSGFMCGVIHYKECPGSICLDVLCVASTMKQNAVQLTRNAIIYPPSLN